MNLQRVLAVVKKGLKKTLREPGALFLMLLFPIMLTIAFGVSMGGIGGDGTQTFDIGVVDHNSVGSYPAWSARLIENMTANPILRVHAYGDEVSANDSLTQGKLSAVVVIPSDFGESCESFRAHPTDPAMWVNTTVQLSVDRASLVATQAIPPIVQQAIASTVTGQQAGSLQLPVGLGSASLVEAEKRSTFFFMVPGLFAYGAVFIIMLVGQSFSYEREEGLLRRMNTTPLTSSEFMTGETLYNMVAAVLQVAVIFLTAFAVGYRPDTGVEGLALAFLLMSLFSMCCVGFGLITATVAKSSGGATGLAFVFILPMMFFGTFMSGATGGGISAEIGKFLPAYYVTDSLTTLFARGAPVSSPTVLANLLVVLVYSIAVLLVGVLLYRRFGNR